MNLFPYTNFHELNLDWIIEKIKENSENLVEFVKLNTIKYANPLQWDITHQYEANTVVIDEVTGYAYLSAKAVPAGVQIDNTEYWIPVFNVFTIYEAIKTGVAYNNRNVDTSLYDIPEGALVWVNQKMFKTTKPIGKGDRFTTSNTVATTVEAELRALLAKLGDLGTKYDTEIAGMDAKVDEVNTRLNTKIDANKEATDTAINGLNTKVDSNKADADGKFTALNNKVDELSAGKFKRVIMLGDSYSEGYTPEGNVTPWPDLLAAKLPGSEVHYVKQSGAGLSTVFTGIYNLTTRLSELTIDNPETIDSIIVCCGRNDANHTNVVDSIAPGISNFCSVAKAKFPNAHVYIGFIGYDTCRTDYNVNRTLWLANALAWYQHGTGYTYLNGVEHILCNKDFMSSDGKHPNAYGEVALANGIYKALTYGSVNVTYIYNEVSVNGTEIKVGESFANGFASVRFNTAPIDYYSGVQYTADGKSQFAIGSDVYLRYVSPSGYGLTSGVIPCIAEIAGKYYQTSCVIRVIPQTDGKCLMVGQLSAVTLDGTTYASGTLGRVQFIQSPQFTLRSFQ